MRINWYRPFALLCMVVVPLALFGQDAQREASSNADEASIAQRERLEANTLRIIWWNNESKVEVLSLTAEQREAMDDKLRTFLHARNENAVAQRDAYGAFGTALASGNEAASREAADQVVELTSTPLRIQTEMMIEVIALLSSDQRETMASEWPNLMSSPWVRRGLDGRVPARRARN